MAQTNNLSNNENCEKSKITGLKKNDFNFSIFMRFKFVYRMQGVIFQIFSYFSTVLSLYRHLFVIKKISLVLFTNYHQLPNVNSFGFFFIHRIVLFNSECFVKLSNIT